MDDEVANVIDAVEVETQHYERRVRVPIGLAGVPLHSAHQLTVVVTAVDLLNAIQHPPGVLGHEEAQVLAEPLGLVGSGRDTQLREEDLVDEALDPGKVLKGILRTRHLLGGEPVRPARVAADRADEIGDDGLPHLRQEGSLCRLLLSRFRSRLPLFLSRRRRLRRFRLLAEDGEDALDGFGQPHLFDRGSLLERGLNGRVGNLDLVTAHDGERGTAVVLDDLDDPGGSELDGATLGVHEDEVLELLRALRQSVAQNLREHAHLKGVGDGHGGLALGHVAADVDLDDLDLGLLHRDDRLRLGGRGLNQVAPDFLDRGAAGLEGLRKQLAHGPLLHRDLLRLRLGGRGFGGAVDHEGRDRVVETRLDQALTAGQVDLDGRIQLGLLELRDGGGPNALHLAQQFENGRDGRGRGLLHDDLLCGISAVKFLSALICIQELLDKN